MIIRVKIQYCIFTLTLFLVCPLHNRTVFSQGKGIGIKGGVGFHAHLNHAILLRPRHTHQDIARLALPPVERGSFRLVDFARNQLPRTGDAAAIFAGNRDLDARCLAGIVYWLVFAHLKSYPASVLQSHSVFLYTSSHPGAPV